MARLAAAWKKSGQSLALVPTMGALHEGHATLLRRARKENRRVVLSVFVNPTQFGPKEDFSRYPRTLASDARLAAACGVDAIYAPSAPVLYPEGFSTFVSVRGLSDLLCGAFRPGHFAGVATVVLKLLETVRPDRAYFGEKDFQQLVIVTRMAAIRPAGENRPRPTVRESDGWRFSRNRYLPRRARPGARSRLEWAVAEARRPG